METIATVAVTTRPCFVCNQTGTLTVPVAGLVAYRDGAMVQHAFPMLSADDREQLVSGIHPACWEAMMS